MGSVWERKISLRIKGLELVLKLWRKTRSWGWKDGFIIPLWIFQLLVNEVLAIRKMSSESGIIWICGGFIEWKVPEWFIK